MAEYRHSRVSDRDDEYRAKRRNLIISPERHDPFADGLLLNIYYYSKYYRNIFFLWCCDNFIGGKTPDPKARTYIDIMQEQGLKKEEVRTSNIIV